MKTFSLEFTADEPKAKKLTGKYQKFDAFNRYRRSEDKERNCGNCKYSCYTEISDRCRKVYKCKQRGVACSAQSDIRIRNICDLYEKEGARNV